MLTAAIPATTHTPVLFLAHSAFSRIHSRLCQEQDFKQGPESGARRAPVLQVCRVLHLLFLMCQTTQRSNSHPADSPPAQGIGLPVPVTSGTSKSRSCFRMGHPSSLCPPETAWCIALRATQHTICLPPSAAVCPWGSSRVGHSSPDTASWNALVLNQQHPGSSSDSTPNSSFLLVHGLGVGGAVDST